MTVRSGVKTFFDSNVLVYSDDAASLDKQEIALDLIEEHQYRGSGVVSVQVLQEYFVSSTKKLKVDALVARDKVEIFSAFDVAIPIPSDVISAIDLHRIHAVSFWDALILQMAKRSGCRILLSEDMQTGRIIDGVEIVNPFPCYPRQTDSR